ncbi:MAG: hypothetical protein II193_10245 [Lachnospiraceae bacterium]|nr:hypothetical protein [Lachnospiraceae bacterium]
MARGTKKTIQEKILQKEELIEALTVRLKKENEELNELLELKKMEELNELRTIIQNTGMDIADIIKLAEARVAQ